MHAPAQDFTIKLIVNERYSTRARYTMNEQKENNKLSKS